MRVVLLGLAVACSIACSGSREPQSDWPGWRGPRQDGSAPLRESGGSGEIALELAWKRPLGPGYSSVSIVGETAVTMDSDGEFDRLVAFRADSGEKLWSRPIAPTHRQAHPEAEDGPLGTPTIHDGAVYALGPRGDLFSVELADGSLRWKQRIDETLGARAQSFGFATSPLLIEGTLIVPTGAGEDSSTCGLDPADGSVRWCRGSDAVGYQSAQGYGANPAVALLPTDAAVYAFDPTDGEELWRFEHIAPVPDGYAQLVPFGDERLLVNYFGWTAGYRIAHSAAGTTVEESWRTQELARSQAAPVVRAGRVYGFRFETLVCLDAATGELLWSDDGTAGRGLIALGDLLVIWSFDGDLVLAAPGPEGIDEVARVATGLESSYTGPSYAGGRLFVRNGAGIAAIRVSASR